MQHVDDAGELVLDADRDVHRDALRRELRAERLERAEEVGALAVEHVHEDEAREPELLAEAPCARCPDLDAHHARDGDEHAVDDARSRPQLALEGRVAGDVEQVELSLLPGHVRERHRDRELAVVLVLVGVGDCRPRLDGAEAVDRAGLEEERLDERRLPRPAVADDGDVTDLGGLGHGSGSPPRALGSSRKLSRGEAASPSPSPSPAAYVSAASRCAPARCAFRRRIAFVCSCETRDSVTPRTSPISRSVSSS